MNIYSIVQPKMHE